MTTLTTNSLRRAVLAGAVLVVMTSASRQAQAQLIEAALSAKKAFDYAKGAYDAYKSGRDFLQPEPTTADLIAAAVTSIENLIVDTTSAEAFGHARTAIDGYRSAAHASRPAPLLAAFDSAALASLNEIDSLLTVPRDPRYAHWLGPIYNSLMALYLANHLAARTWGSTVSQAQLEQEFLATAKRGLQLDYDMIGGSVIANRRIVDTTTTSQLGRWVLASSNGGPIATTAERAASYFQTDAAVQAIQRAAAALVALLARAGVFDPTVVYDASLNISVQILLSHWTDNWRGSPDGVWTGMEPWVYGTHIVVQPCPRDFGIISVRQLDLGLASYLCAPLPGTPVPSATLSTYLFATYKETCSGSGRGALCSERTRCAPDEIATSPAFGYLQCIKRVDSGTLTLPMRGEESFVELTFSPLPALGAYYDLPSGMVLTGIDPTDYTHRNFTYFMAPVYPAVTMYSSMISLMAM